ncbi:hypothetical protein AVEN_249337-1 [Araneus ventricosus]|uniref:CUB domain-containing protein n=1 Tax=Araneus ventricosus TaxID=182803 RepID=A0A4Y2K4H9_ARAVE|nr:hypothetical protein AVEN_249337-1 [Araneus ventricosus]
MASLISVVGGPIILVGVISTAPFSSPEAEGGEFKSVYIGLQASSAHVAFSDSCTRLNAISGTISNEMNEDIYSKCWKIIVPSNSYIQLNMVSFSSSNSQECSHTSVEVSIASKNDKYTFCPGVSNWQPVIAFNDITVTHIIDYNSGFYYKELTSEFKMRYRGENYLCAQKDIFKCYGGACIPQSQVCDGIKHCYNGDDEKGCETGVFAVRGVDDSRLNGTRRLKEKWSPSSGWQENTHRGIIALHLATERNDTGVDIEGKLMVKQLEVQALASLLRNTTDPLTANQLSMFVNALTASCQDPHNFYGYDLVKLLKDKVETSSLTSHPVSYLALCNAGGTLPVNGTSELSKVLNSDSEYPFLIDVQAAAVMAFSCLRANQRNGSNSSLFDSDYDEAVAKFKQLQLKDGSFGNIYTTAIVTQALLSAGEENSKDWNLQTAVNYLMKHLNSSSVDFLATYLILPILNGKSLSDIRNINCSDGSQHKSQGDALRKSNKKRTAYRKQYLRDVQEIVLRKIDEKYAGFRAISGTALILLLIAINDEAWRNSNTASAQKMEVLKFSHDCNCHATLACIQMYIIANLYRCRVVSKLYHRTSLTQKESSGSSLEYVDGKSRAIFRINLSPRDIH